MTRRPTISQKTSIYANFLNVNNHPFEDVTFKPNGIERI